MPPPNLRRAAILMPLLSPMAAAAETPPVVVVVAGGESRTPPSACQVTVIGPGVNQPPPHPGYGGFVGWNSPLRRRDGDWLVVFSTGYWHASPPTPLRFSKATIDEYTRLGLPAGIVSPRGGTAMLIRSSDEGRHWSAPEVLLDTPEDDRHPSLLEWPDGTLLCLHGSYPRGGLRLIFSRDHGRSWIAPAADHGFLVDECYGYGKACELPDGSLLVTHQDTGGHTAADAKAMSLRLLRVRLRPDHSGIDLLPPGGR